jgi:SPX domain protein involved in polyphosphate accumulation
MKFGKDLATNMVKKWEAHYIDYEAMKRILTTGNTPEVKREFHAMYEAQLKKVSAFYLSEVARVEQAVATRNTQLKAMSAVDEVQTSGQHYQVFRDLTDLRSFTWINAEGFRKIAKKYDKLMDLRGTDATEAEMLEAQLLREPFMGNKIQEFLDGLKGDKAWSRVKTGDGAMELKIISGTANHGLA